MGFRGNLGISWVFDLLKEPGKPGIYAFCRRRDCKFCRTLDKEEIFYAIILPRSTRNTKLMVNKIKILQALGWTGSTWLLSAEEGALRLHTCAPVNPLRGNMNSRCLFCLFSVSSKY